MTNQTTRTRWILDFDFALDDKIDVWLRPPCTLLKCQTLKDYKADIEIVFRVTACHNMPALKRKRTTGPDRESPFEGSVISEVPASDVEVDISSTLTARKRQHSADGEEYGDDEEFIRETMAKHNIKSGTDMLKRTKGKNKLAKGEVGGGSFQSMGEVYCLFVGDSRQPSLYRSSPSIATFPDTAWLPNPDAHSASNDS